MSKCNAAVRQGKWKLCWPPIPEAMEVPRPVIDLDERIKTETVLPEFPFPFDDSGRFIPAPCRPSLFNLEDDPFERHDLADDRPDLVRSMTAAFEKWFEDVEKDYRIAAKEKRPPV